MYKYIFYFFLFSGALGSSSSSCQSSLPTPPPHIHNVLFLKSQYKDNRKTRALFITGGEGGVWVGGGEGFKRGLGHRFFSFMAEGG